ncbi:MAG: hypothetical protein IJ867_04940 [Clostridia bacterium]|nr:hypothetical protein [Clostridia bacterium]
MENNKIKNTIVLRGMASNVVDEAIVILKPNVKIKKTQGIKKVGEEKNTSKELILKEAEHIVSEYVNRIGTEELKKEKMRLERRVKKLQVVSLGFLILLIITLIIK